MVDNLPFVSVIIPCRNEEKFIGKCLDSLVSQDFPSENLEVLVVDGASTDKTKEIAKSFNVKILDNPNKYTPFGLNIGIENTKGEIIVRMDAHANYPKDYISKCVRYLQESGASNVGGVIKTLPSQDTISAKAVAECLSSPFGAASDFRLGLKEAREVDTVFGGCYKREVFVKVGLFNEKLWRSQDLEFNLRLKKAGGKIMLFPDIVVEYYPQSTLTKFLYHNFEDGVWSTLPLRLAKMKFRPRHYLPLLFVLTLPLSIWFYLPASWLFSWHIALKEKDWRFLFLMPVAFACRHFGYGLGSLWGLIKIIVPNNR